MYLYIDEYGKPHKVNIHNFGTDKTKVRVTGSIKLNPTDTNYPDKKWVNVSELYEQATFTPEFIKAHSF